MRHLKQEPETVDYAEDYVKISILGLWPLVMFEGMLPPQLTNNILEESLRAR